MMTIVRTLVVFAAEFFFCGLLAGGAGAAQEASGAERLLHIGPAGRATLSDPASIEAFLDGYVAAAMADQYPPGVMVAVATRDKVFVKAYGLADAQTGEKATTETLFRIGSISKTFIWISVAMLADEGKLDLDADVNSYLRSVKVKERFGRPVTLNDLMAHRAGFEDTLGDFFQSKSGRGFEEALKRTRPARIAPPGERTSYSNWGADLAAEIVAEVSGMPYDEFVRTRILAPIGMTSTILHDPASIAGNALNPVELDARLAAPHKLAAGAPAAMRHDALDPLHAAGAVAFDAHDAGRWVRFLLNDGVAGEKRLLSPEAFTLMRLRAFPDRPSAPDFAHGFMETEIAGHTAFGHGGTLSGFIADMTIMPSLGVGVLVVANGAEAPRLPDLVSRAVIEQFAGENSYSSRWPAAADDKMKKAAKSVAGVYAPNRRVEARLEKLASIGSEIRIAARGDGSLVVSADGSTRRFYPLAEDLWTDRSRDRLFVYRGGNGSVKRISISLGTDTAEPVSFLQSSDGFNAALGLAGAFSLLAFVGAWRRQGRRVETSPAGRWLAIGHALAALVWLAFIGVLVWASVDLGAKELADLQETGWPPGPLLATQIAAHAAALAAILAAVGIVPALVRSGWSIWRMAHYAFFAAAGLFAVYELWIWRAIFAPASG